MWFVQEAEVWGLGGSILILFLCLDLDQAWELLETQLLG